MRKTYQELEFKDAFMFAAVMSDAESCRGVLERILGIPIRKVMVHAEHVLFVNPETRGVRLDVYADDEHGTVYNVEMQTTDNKKSAAKKQVLSRTDGYGCFEDRGRFCKAAAEYRDLYLHI